MKSTITTGKESRERLIDGINAIANAVKVTLGGAGRNVVIDHKTYRSPHITKDGVTVARAVFLEDKTAQAGVRLIKNVADTAVESSGDGTTTATVIAQSIVNQGAVYIPDDVNRIMVSRGIEEARKRVEEKLRSVSKPIEYGSKELIDVATISANGDESIGEVVAKAVTLAGDHGRITVEKSDSIFTTLDHVDGLVVDSGWLSPYFVNNMDKRTVEYDNPMIFVTNKKISLFSEIIGLVKISNTIGRPLVIVAQEIIGEALQTIIANSMRNNIMITAIEAPSFGDLSKEYLSDIATITGGTLVSQESGIDLKEVTPEMLGSADKVIISQLETKIIGGKGSSSSISNLVTSIQKSLSQEDNEDYVVDFLENRLAKITGGVVVIRVGAQTSIELDERKDRFDDAIGATKAAMESGIIPGGGVALFQISKNLDCGFNNKEFKIGESILLNAIAEPAIQILENSGLDRDQAIYILKELDGDQVYDVVGEDVVNYNKAGIIDPLKVTLSSLNSAVSIGSIILTTEVSIVNED